MNGVKKYRGKDFIIVIDRGSMRRRYVLLSIDSNGERTAQNEPLYSEEFEAHRRERRAAQGMADSLEELIKVGKQRGYHHGWAYRVWQSRRDKQRLKEKNTMADSISAFA